MVSVALVQKHNGTNHECARLLFKAMENTIMEQATDCASCSHPHTLPGVENACRHLMLLLLLFPPLLAWPRGL
jgi:hypothetical protein